MGVLDDIREQYPTLSFLINDPEIGPLLRDAVDPNKGFSPQAFQAKLYQTNWFKKKSAFQRQMLILQNTDPAEYKRQINSGIQQVKSIVDKLGVRLTNAEAKYIATSQLDKIGSPEFMMNLRDFLVKQKDNKFGQGGISGAQFDVNDMARRQFYVPLSHKEARKWGIELALGTENEASLREYLSKKAASLFPHLKDQLLAGASMEDLFSGHRAIIAEELEVAPDSIDFTKQYKKVLQQIDPQTEKPRPMTLHETQTMARQDDRWWQTSKGRQQDAGMANAMLKMFGKRA